jgi:hypothetical protein
MGVNSSIEGSNPSFSVGGPSGPPRTERWQSGRMRRSRKPLRVVRLVEGSNPSLSAQPGRIPLCEAGSGLIQQLRVLSLANRPERTDRRRRPITRSTPALSRSAATAVRSTAGARIPLIRRAAKTEALTHLLWPTVRPSARHFKSAAWSTEPRSELAESIWPTSDAGQS